MRPSGLARLYPLQQYPSLVERRQAVAAYVVSTAAILILIPGVLLDPNWVTLPLWAIAGFVGIGVTAFTWVLTARGQLNNARWLILGITLLGGTVPWLDSGLDINPALLQILFLLEAAIFLETRMLAWAIALSFLIDVLFSLNAVALQRFDLSNTVTVVSLNTLSAVLIIILAQGWRRGLAALDAQSHSRQVALSELSSSVTQRIFQRLDLETLLNETVTLVQESFDTIYHAQIFLVDSHNQQAVLRASTGQVGQELIRRGHTLPVGSQSVIGQVTASGQPVLARDTSRDPVHRRNELLPNTLTELALPLKIGEQIIGALDVQSQEADAFTFVDVTVLQTLANQIATAIDNAQLFAEQQAQIAQNRQLVLESQRQIEQIELLNRQLTSESWASYLQGQEFAPALTVDFESGEMTPNAEWTPGLSIAARHGTVLSEEVEGHQVLALPLTVRGQVIGAMEFEFDDDTVPNLQHATLAREVAERLSLAIESNRLYENAQQLAHREAVINDISAKLQVTSSVESALDTAVQGLQAALGVPHIAIRLGTPPPKEAAAAPGQEVQA